MKPRIAFYGDDFTGSTDAMEVLQWSGLKTILLLEPPSRQQLDQFSDFHAFGVAGNSRSMSPKEMEAVLRPAFQKLRDSGADFVHYKTCSTFDSAPQVGSIGKALEIGREVFGSRVVPVVIAAPNLGRYQVFGNLFARSGLDSEPYRLDRHPTMMHHPITPMNESDMRLHLAKQTDLGIGLCDVLNLNSLSAADLLNKFKSISCDAIIYDVMDSGHLTKIGELFELLNKEKTSQFVLGSSGIEYALTHYWQSKLSTEQRAQQASLPQFARVEQLVAITGSCSPVNDRQLTWAEKNGFTMLGIDASRLMMDKTSDNEIDNCIQHALEHLKHGRNLILHSSRGPQDPRIHRATSAMRELGFSDDDIRLQSGKLLGPKLGQILRGILNVRPLPRVGVAGGDTSGFIARALGIIAMETIAPVAPGSPLCRVHSDNFLNGAEIFFKGGQVGKDDVWEKILHGTRGQ